MAQATPTEGTLTACEADTPTSSKTPRSGSEQEATALEASSSSTSQKRKQSTSSEQVTQKKPTKAVNQPNRALKIRITDLKSLLAYLKRERYISEFAKETLEDSLTDLDEIHDDIKRILRGEVQENYAPETKTFIMNLHFYSPPAYNLVRDTFNNSLPDPATLREWNQVVDGVPGFTKESLQALKKRSESSTTPILCNLVMDEFQLWKDTDWDGERIVGYLDFGTGFDTEWISEARQIHLFLVTAVNAHFKVPVAYFCTSSLDGLEKANLVTTCLRILHETGVKIISFTFKREGDTLEMARHLGAKVSDMSDVQPFFKHPVTEEKVYVFPDITYSVIFLGLCLESQKIVTTRSGQKLVWKYFELLAKLKNIQILPMANKSQKIRLQHARDVLKLKVATKTFITSVADALDMLRVDLGVQAFSGSADTAQLCRLLNDVCEVLNSSSVFGGQALTPATEKTVFDLFAKAKTYMQNLRLKAKGVSNFPNKSGFTGLITAMESLKGLYTDYADGKYLLGHKFSLDHARMFFDSFNFLGVPTAFQFQAAYKKLVKKIATSDKLDSLTAMHYNSNKSTCTDWDEDLEKSNYKKIRQQIEEHQYISASAWHLTCSLESVVTYTTKLVINCLKRCVTCAKCSRLLQRDKSQFIFTICTLAEKRFRLAQVQRDISSKRVKYSSNLVRETVQQLPQGIFGAFGDHIYDDEIEALNWHAFRFIKLILRNYLETRVRHETPETNTEDRAWRMLLNELFASLF